jgi:replication initiation protein RepC
MDAGLIAHQGYANVELPPEGVNKYEVLRELTTARKRFGITDRELAVLHALLSFYPQTILGGNSADLLVYPSNAAICERLNGMPCSTMRRHLSGLVDAGLILRRDSPNGKRYVKRHGGEAQAFGFDLTPLVARFADICVAAEVAREEEDQFQRLRRAVSLMRRDLAGLAAFGQETRPEVSVWCAFSELALNTARNLRRTLSTPELAAMQEQLGAALDHARDLFDLPESENMSTNESQNEQHIQNSNKDLYDFEPCLEKAKGHGTDAVTEAAPEPVVSKDQDLPNIPIGLVTAVCHEVRTYAPDKIRHWHQLVRAAEVVRPMMGISASAWQDAVAAMGPEEASVVVVAMLERFGEIKSPGGYLRHLTQKAELGAFSCGPMVMALMRRDAA